MSIENKINLAIAIGTISAVIVALFGDAICAMLFKPKITISLSDNPDRNRTSLGDDVWYYHLVIANTSSYIIAKNTIVVLTQINESSTNSEKQLWHGEVPLVWMFGRVYGNIFRNIGSTQFCDLIAVGREKGAFLEPLIWPYNMPHNWNSAMCIKVTVKVKSDQCTTNEQKFVISWDGHWAYEKDEMAKHFSIKMLP